MDNLENYALIHVNPKAILEFDESTYCDDLMDVARSDGKNVSDYGVVEVTGEKSHACKFADLDGLDRAMAALVNHYKIVVVSIYKRQ